jgi:glycosyltransferase involved in cell wall biosynthesis
MLKCFPDALVCVDEAEKADYEEVVPRGRLVLHPPTNNVVDVRNWMIDYFQEDCIFQIDDDFEKIQCYCNADIRDITFIRDPVHIAQIIDNAHWPAFDLGIGVFCWARFGNPINYSPFQPMSLCGAPVMCAFGMRGSARKRKFDNSVPGMADLQFSLETYRDDRIAYCDTRYYWDFGKIYGGVGGNLGMVSTEMRENTVRVMRSRWTKYLHIGNSRDATSKGSKTRLNTDTQAISIRVARKSLQAVRSGFWPEHLKKGAASNAPFKHLPPRQ